MSRYLALIPAAGTGSRIGGDRPKQYQPLLGQPMLLHALGALCRHPRVSRTYVVLSPRDPWFRRFDWSVFGDRLAPLYCGSDTRARSVRNGLEQGEFEADDWVLVHDAARPCLSAADIDRLIDAVGDDAAGGLLALPVADTLKRSDAGGRIAATEPRERMWRAQTPQLFQHALLLRALTEAGGDAATDESSAVERLGFSPRLVQGSADNLKVTYPEDFVLAEAVIAARKAST